MSEAQGAANAQANTQTTNRADGQAREQQSTSEAKQTRTGNLVDANRPRIKDEYASVENKLNPKQETQAAQERRKIKVDDQEVDEEEVLRIYKERKKHQSVASKELNEGKLAKQQAETLIKMLKDPSQFWKLASDPRIGHDARKLAEEFLAGKLQEDMMDPRERELRDAKLKLKEYEDLQKKEQEEIERKKTEALQKRWTETYTQDIVKALDVSGLPRKPETVKRIANKMYLALKIGENISAEEATALVKEDLIEESKSIYSATPAETLASLLGEENLKKIREWDISRLKGVPNAPKVEGAKEIEPRSKKFMSPQEFRRFNRGR